MAIQNPPVASVVVCPIDSTAAAPAISFGGSVQNKSGTGLYGTFGSVSHAISGAAALTVDANGVTLTNNVMILNGAGAPVDGTTGDNIAGPGSLYIDTTGANAYIQSSLITTPVWKLITRAA